MNNIEKKIDALIDALGFDVEYIPDRHPRGFCNDSIKLNKRDVIKPYFVPLPIESIEWGCIVEYLNNHDEDIAYGNDDFGTLRPILGFISRNSNHKN